MSSEPAAPEVAHDPTTDVGDGERDPSGADEEGDPTREDEGRDPVSVGEYTWAGFMREHGHAADVDRAYRDVDDDDGGGGLFGFRSEPGRRVPASEDWAAVEFDPEAFLGFPPAHRRRRLERGAGAATAVWNRFQRWIDATPVVEGEYTWEHFKWEYYYGEDGALPRDDAGEIVPFEPADYLGFDPDAIGDVLAAGAENARQLRVLEERRTVNVDPDLDEDAFFSTVEGHTTLTNRYDLEKAVPMPKKLHFVEEERYWVNEPYAFVTVFHSLKENERKYYLVDPYRNEIEADLVEFLSGKLRTAIKYSDDEAVVRSSDDERGDVLERETRRLLDRYDLYADAPGERGDGADGADDGVVERVKRLLDRSEGAEASDGDDGSLGDLDGIAARPEPAVLAEDPGTLTEYQVEKVLYSLTRDFIGYGRIDGIKHDINVEDISCDGYNSPVFVYHSDYEQLITNVHHGEDRLDDFVVKLAQRSGKGISKRQPQVDATLPDGSRAQLTLGKEVSDHGTNYTIRQFKDVPFTPIDLVNWHTFSLEEMAFLWLCIENNKSLIFAGGTASGKTTSLNAVSLFIPSNTKIVSIEDTREVELPQRNWVASVTRPSFSQDNAGNVDEFDLLEAALRQRPDYIVMGEIRGEEGRTLFQVMSTGHTTYTTFHADSVDEVLKRFTTEPINVSKTLFTALDLVSIQTSTRVEGQKVRRNKALTEINEYDAENDEISVQDVYQWQPETDGFLELGRSKKLQEIAFDRGWSQETLEDKLFERQVILAYLIRNELNEYAQVAATVQAFINDPDTILALIANDRLEVALDDLREMESVLIDVDPAKEEMVPRPEPGEEALDRCDEFLSRADEELFPEYRGRDPDPLANALPSIDEANGITATPGAGQQLLGAVAPADPDGSGPARSPGNPSGAAATDAATQSDDAPTAAGAERAATDETRPADERTRTATDGGDDHDRS